ncbi:type II toxin-antitoxin system VapC family toxin [Granulicella cerasi]|uniref:Ribonuclease VapC n=1 Tax=Granulicella cerasi TaxID=741063 RepID=A0ABW1ZB26_9BACT|nr:type II toxin-antitoxin system VapC family toxin [Granulicella cerasi]
MAQFLLDTNIASFLIKGSSTALDHRFRQFESSSVVSVITEAEMRYGLARLPDEAKLHLLVKQFFQRIDILAWTSSCAVQYASLHAQQQRKGKPLSIFDTMIAAHALANDLVLVTNDAAFANIENLKLEDWTKGPQRA